MPRAPCAQAESRDEDFQVIFTLIDRGRSGSIDAAEMAAVLCSSGRMEPEAAEAVAAGGASAEGRFEFGAFRALLEASLAKTTLKLAARQGAPAPSADSEMPRHYVVVTLLSVLDEYRKRREDAGDYPAAASVKEVYAAVQLEEERRLHDAVDARQKAERAGVEEAHVMEAMEFNSAWSRNMADFERQSAEIEEQTLQRHALDFARFQVQIREAAPNRQKFSRALLNLRRVQDNMAKQCKCARGATCGPRVLRRGFRPTAGAPHGPSAPAAVRLCRCLGMRTRRPQSSRPTSSRPGRRPSCTTRCRWHSQRASCR